MTPEEEQALMMQMIDRHEGPAGPIQGNFTDPNQILAPMLSREFNIPVEEIIAIPPVEGLTLRQQLERLRPNTGGIEWGVDGEQITGKIEF